ncbi:MAG: PRC-barrel domain-containing protein [Candidatus Bathyarchaeia archaeon]
MSKRYLTREDLQGKDVIDLEATRIGTVKDIVLDPETQKLFLAIARTVESGVEEQSYISGERIEKIRDVVLVKPSQGKPS